MVNYGQNKPSSIGSFGVARLWRRWVKTRQMTRQKKKEKKGNLEKNESKKERWV